jgi:hypothetical protein
MLWTDRRDIKSVNLAPLAVPSPTFLRCTVIPTPPTRAHGPCNHMLIRCWWALMGPRASGSRYNLSAVLHFFFFCLVFVRSFIWLKLVWSPSTLVLRRCTLPSPCPPFCSYDSKGILVTKFRLIALQYVRTFFAVDVVSSMPEIVSPAPVCELCMCMCMSGSDSQWFDMCTPLGLTPGTAGTPTPGL